MNRAVESDRGRLSIGRDAKLTLQHACPNNTRLYADDSWEWHRFALDFKSDVFSATLLLDTWLSPLLSFRDELILLNQNLSGMASLSTVEGHIKLEGRIDKRGTYCGKASCGTWGRSLLTF